MVKYYSTSVVFEEIPDEITLAIEITNCPGHCEGCHSPWLREDIGEELTPERLNELIDKNDGITCVCFMGEGNDKEGLLKLARVVRDRHLWPALYSGREEVEESYGEFFKYIKVGPYIEEFGPLNKETTNQRLYENDPEVRVASKIGNKYWFHWQDITYKFWKRQ